MRRGRFVAGVCLALLAVGSGALVIWQGVMNPQPANSERAQKAVLHLTPVLGKELELAGLTWGTPMMIRIFKRESRLELWLWNGTRFTRFRDYDICAWSGKLGPKLKEGDGQSPEGFYHVRPGQMNPRSNFHLSFNLGFPNEYDRAHGRTGSFLMVHGNCSSIGCYAMGRGSAENPDNTPIEEIWTLMTAAYAAGQDSVQVQAYPFEMTPENLAKEAESEWIDFWRNLAEGDAIFQATGRPPRVSVDADKRYVFAPGPAVETPLQ